MGTQLYLPAGWARRLESRLDPTERLAELEEDRLQAKGDIREILDRLAEKHGATVRDVTAAMLSIDANPRCPPSIRAALHRATFAPDDASFVWGRLHLLACPQQYPKPA